MMKKIRLFFILLVLVLLGTVHVKAQHTGSYQCTKIVEANGIMKKGDAPHIWYFTFNQKVVYESDLYGNATQGGQMYAYFFVGRQGDMMIFEQRSLLDHSNPFIVNMENVLSNYTGIKSTRMLVSNDYKTLNICQYDANNKLVRTRVYNYVNPQRPGAVEIPDLIR